MSPLPPLSPRNKLVNARKSIYVTIHNKRYMLVPLFNRNGKLIRAQKINLNAGSPYKARAMHEIFPPTPKKRRVRPRTPSPKARARANANAKARAAKANANAKAKSRTPPNKFNFNAYNPFPIKNEKAK